MERTPSISHVELRSSDFVAVSEQLGREPTTPFAVVCRCTGGHPLVIRNAPIDASGRPFPTTYWLTCPSAVKAVAQLESEGWIARFNEELESDFGFAELLAEIHRTYAEERARELPDALDWGGVGGTRRGVKCLHAHYAHYLAGGADPVGGWVAEQIEPIHPDQRSGRVAAVDQGTNSIRLIVVEPSRGEDPVELARDLVITRLGKGVDKTGRIDADALARTLAVLERYCRRARALGAERIRVAATSAVREATNREEYATAVRDLARGELEVISGEREAELSYLGATRGLDVVTAPPPYLVLDIGGGSTEFVIGEKPGAAGETASVRLGSVRLTERHVRSDPPSPADLEALGAAVDESLDEVEKSMQVADALTLVAVAGTATTIQAISLGLDRYDPDRIHRTWLARDDAERVLVEIARMTTTDRAAMPVMAPGRGDVIVAGASILLGVMRRFGFERALVSETDILDGLALELLDIR
jgi:exopolyphosphatase / guanosine-5'-triphosphate,3'-diphosphate pyrophosphatase